MALTFILIMLAAKYPTQSLPILIFMHGLFYAARFLCTIQPKVKSGPRLQPMLLTRSVLMQGFIISNYQSRFGEGIIQLSQWVKEGKLTYKETIVNGFDKLPEAFIALFAGSNTGKMIVKA